MESFLLLTVISFGGEGVLYAVSINKTKRAIEMKAGIFFIIFKYNQRAMHTCYLAKRRLFGLSQLLAKTQHLSILVQVLQLSRRGK
jgi:hypothetical protein